LAPLKDGAGRKPMLFDELIDIAITKGDSPNDTHLFSLAA